jgi:hypothetical protein
MGQHSAQWVAVAERTLLVERAHLATFLVTAGLARPCLALHTPVVAARLVLRETGAQEAQAVAAPALKEQPMPPSQALPTQAAAAAAATFPPRSAALRAARASSLFVTSSRETLWLTLHK